MIRTLDWSMLLLWTVATLVGVFISLLVAVVWAAPAALAGTPPPLVGGLGGAMLGAGTGLAQWLVLRRKARASRWWTPASAIGGLLGLAVGAALAEVAGAGVSESIVAWGRPDAATGARLTQGLLTGALTGAVFGAALGVASG